MARSLTPSSAASCLGVTFSCTPTGYRRGVPRGSRRSRQGKCSAGQKTSKQAYILPTNDRPAESKVIKAQNGSIAAFVVAHGYGPETQTLPGPRSSWR